jgi:hypothetical protein
MATMPFSARCPPMPATRTGLVLHATWLVVQCCGPELLPVPELTAGRPLSGGD